MKEGGENVIRFAVFDYFVPSLDFYDYTNHLKPCGLKVEEVKLIGFVFLVLKVF